MKDDKVMVKNVSIIFGFLVWFLQFPSNSLAMGSEYTINIRESPDEGEIENALEVAREHRASFPNDTIVINLPTKVHVTKKLNIGPQDSGIKDAPLIIRGNINGGTSISGGKFIASALATSDDFAQISAIPSAARGKLLKLNIRGLNVDLRPYVAAHGAFDSRPPGRLFVYEKGERLSLVRWPLQGYAVGPQIVPSGDADDKVINATGAQLLGNEKNAWIGGFWKYNWSYETAKVKSNDGQTITFQKPKDEISTTARYRLFNAASFLVVPGYYYVSDSGSIYYIPNKNDKSGGVTIPVVDTLLYIDRAKNIKFENIAFEYSIANTVLVENSENIQFRRCFVGHSGTSGLIISGGKDNDIESCVIDDTGYTAIALSGGDRKTLSPAGYVIKNSYIGHFGREMPAYQPGVHLFGVGQKIEGCEINGASHSGIIFSGNNFQFIGNTFHDLVNDTTDAGAIYGGRNWTSRGTVIAYNYFYNISNKVDATSVRGVYLDDQLSGTDITANVFRNVDEPILIGGGRDNLVEDNLFISSKGSPIRVDSRGLSWEAGMAQEGGILREGLKEVPYQSPVYKTSYPELFSILADRPGAPINNRFNNNLGVVTPIVFYDRSEISALGSESGNEVIPKVGEAFPNNLEGIPADYPSLPNLQITRKYALEVERNMKSLLYIWKITDSK